MKTSTLISILGAAVATVVMAFMPSSAVAAGREHSSDLKITRDATGKVVVSWNGKGALKQATSLNGRFKPAKSRGTTHVTAPEGEQMLYLVDAGGAVYSVNIVGYVNLYLPPGLSLIANPIWAIDNSLESLFYYQVPPDGSQVLTFVPALGTYEVSTYDAITGTWSNPDLDLTPGRGFYFSNSSTNTLTNTFVGEVHTGTLNNPFPAGFSLEGPLVPQAGSVNTVHGIPGQPGDRLYFHVSGSLEGGDYIVCEYQDGWVPDVTLQVGQGFMTQMQQPMIWTRVFTVGP